MATGPYDLGPFQTLSAVNFAQGGEWKFFASPPVGFDQSADFFQLFGFKEPNFLYAYWQDVSENTNDNRFKIIRLNTTTKSWSVLGNLGFDGGLFGGIYQHSQYDSTNDDVILTCSELGLPHFPFLRLGFYTGFPLTNFYNWGNTATGTLSVGSTAYRADTDTTYIAVLIFAAGPIAAHYEVWTWPGSGTPSKLTNGPNGANPSNVFRNLNWNADRGTLWATHSSVTDADADLVEWDGSSWTNLYEGLFLPDGAKNLVNGNTHLRHFDGISYKHWKFSADGSSLTEVSDPNNQVGLPLLGFDMVGNASGALFASTNVIGLKGDSYTFST